MARLLFALSLAATLLATGAIAQTPTVRLNGAGHNCSPTDDACKQNRIALVFVHGLRGSNDSWRHESSTKSWPQMISADPDLKSYDVFTVDYDSFATAASPSIMQIYKEFEILLRPLAYQDPRTHEARGYKHVVFIAHSLGGLIVERYLVGVITQGGHFALNRHRIAFLLGTPAFGSHYADFVTFLSQNEQLRILGSVDSNDFMQFLHTNFAQTVEKHEMQGCATIRVFAASEGKDTPTGIGGKIRVVDRDSAVAMSNACHEFPLDHIAIAKPETDHSDLYLGVKRLLAACAREHLTVCPPVPQSGCLHPQRGALGEKKFACGDGDWSRFGQN
jgi:hypothetical protein